MHLRNFLLAICLLLTASVTAQKKSDKVMTEATFKGLKLRNVGPAFTSGRIADIAIHPDDDNKWYVAVGSGGVWLTENAGTTWQPIFASFKTYKLVGRHPPKYDFLTMDTLGTPIDPFRTDPSRL